jgi:hypothetical protein
MALKVFTLGDYKNECCLQIAAYLPPQFAGHIMRPHAFRMPTMLNGTFVTGRLSKSSGGLLCLQVEFPRRLFNFYIVK